ncbi:unnamed protein product [Cyprideis torosa]|uniref:Uncharacterized protein n=1 Tax=Cyprideis torosa TaxID=163714 RepID=A0A7R8ZUJ9_9CRUS|nr:unnamed protein product [Cyprideis torosa]CAG0900364.1 unnamed protein product [Cyprideis torosa]
MGIEKVHDDLRDVSTTVSMAGGLPRSWWGHDGHIPARNHPRRINESCLVQSKAISISSASMGRLHSS